MSAIAKGTWQNDYGKIRMCVSNENEFKRRYDRFEIDSHWILIIKDTQV